MIRIVCLALSILVLAQAAQVQAGFASSVPVSAQLATGIARSMFPQALALGQLNLFLTEPAVIYQDARRLAIRMQVQAYDHRPEEGIARSEQGSALLSGEPGYDPASGPVLLYEAQLEALDFANNNALTRQVRQEVGAAWKSRVSNPVRVDMPPHPFIQPFRGSIRDVTYGKDGIVILVWYE